VIFELNGATRLGYRYRSVQNGSVVRNINIALEHLRVYWLGVELAEGGLTYT